MPTEKETRKLAAIVCADVKGYSRLMGENESYTVGMLQKCRELFSNNIEKHGGRNAVRLNPFPPSPYFHNLAWSYIMVDKFEEAIPEAKKAIAISPNNEIAHRALICAYLSTGREKDARIQAAEVLRIDPDFSVERAAKSSPIKNKEKLATFMEQYRKAGLK